MFSEPLSPLNKEAFMKYKLGIDVGGTFTDFLLLDENGDHAIFKTLSTPQDPSIGVEKGFSAIADFLNLMAS